MKKKYWKYFLIFIICAMASSALTYSIWHLMKAHQDYEDSRDVYEELEDDFIEHPDTQDESQPDTNDGEYEYLQIDFDGLRKVNPDVIAWIDIPGAGISYPVLKGEDNSYYLTHLASGQFGISGSIFMDYHNRPDFSDQNTIIYGHNMKNGSMFENLLNYRDRNFFDENREVLIYTPNAIRHYRIFASYLYDDRHLLKSFDYDNTFIYEQYLNMVLSIRDMNSCIDTETEIGKDDKIITLSTCYGTQTHSRYLVQAVLVSIEK